MAPHSSTLAWKIPWMEEPGRLQSTGSWRVRHDWATSLSLSHIGEGNGNPLQCSWLENPRDGGAWWAAVYGVAQSQTRLKWLSNIYDQTNHRDLSIYRVVINFPQYFFFHWTARFYDYLFPSTLCLLTGTYLPVGWCFLLIDILCGAPLFPAGCHLKNWEAYFLHGVQVAVFNKFISGYFLSGLSNPKTNPTSCLPCLLFLS